MTDIELYNVAKEAYYAGTPIMEDFEFDALEKSLGLENNSYVGTRHNPSYTIKHPFTMGSLSKEQIHEKDGVINWDEHLTKVKKFIKNNPTIITPKYDGCSFEAIYSYGKLVSVSTRGDGEYGRDILSHLKSHLETALANVSKQYEFAFRGEVLIKKSIFSEKYSEYVNPRSFVAGILNRDYTADIESICSDLSVMIYDTRVNEEGNWIDLDWTMFGQFNDSKPYGYIVDGYIPGMSLDDIKIFSADILEEVYHTFETYRNNICEFALDGIVIKPVSDVRINNLTEHRPSDCVAIKFIPMLQETEVVDIEWSVKKTSEMTPVIIVKPVIMDGKKVTRASGHNYGNLINEKISVGTKVILSLAGDIIPFIYKITDTSAFDENKLCLPDCETTIDGCHLMKVMSKEEKTHQSFLNSAMTLNIPSIGPAAAEKIYDYIVENSKGDDFFDIPATEVPNNILLINSVDIERALGGKSGKTAKEAFDKVMTNISLKDIILSCCFTDCGIKAASEIQKFMVDGDLASDFAGLSHTAYSWVLDTNSDNYKLVMSIVKALNKSFDDFKKITTFEKKQLENQIPIIMTGEPNEYASKGEFLKCHPEYRNTGSWKEVQIIFTNSLESNTGKMKKAREKGIEIRLY